MDLHSQLAELGGSQVAPIAGFEVPRQLKGTDLHAFQRQDDEMRRGTHFADLTFAPFTQDKLQEPCVVAAVLHLLHWHGADCITIVQRER